MSRPVLRYHGGKWKLAPWIISHFGPHKVYTEVFGGGASVLMRKARSYAEVYNDLDGEIVNLFCVLRHRSYELTRALEMTPFARDEYKRSFEISKDELEQARRTVVRSYMGFGSNSLNRDIKSGFRSCSNRSGTTPAHDWSNYPAAITEIAERLRGVVIENRDAKQVMAAHDGPQTLHYVDPPYVHSTRSRAMHGNHGYAHEMTDTEHQDLADYLKAISGMVVLSGYHSSLYDRLYSDWRRVDRAALGDGAVKRTEVLWFNDAASSAIPQGNLFALGAAAGAAGGGS